MFRPFGNARPLDIARVEVIDRIAFVARPHPLIAFDRFTADHALVCALRQLVNQAFCRNV